MHDINSEIENQLPILEKSLNQINQSGNIDSSIYAKCVKIIGSLTRGCLEREYLCERLFEIANVSLPFEGDPLVHLRRRDLQTLALIGTASGMHDNLHHLLMVLLEGTPPTAGQPLSHFVHKQNHSPGYKHLITRIKQSPGLFWAGWLTKMRNVTLHRFAYEYGAPHLYNNDNPGSKLEGNLHLLQTIEGEVSREYQANVPSPSSVDIGKINLLESLIVSNKVTERWAIGLTLHAISSYSINL